MHDYVQPTQTFYNSQQGLQKFRKNNAVLWLRRKMSLFGDTVLGTEIGWW